MEDAPQLRKRPEVALRHLRRCVEMDPRFDAALYHLGLIYLKQDNLSLAQEHFRVGLLRAVVVHLQVGIEVRIGVGVGDV